jgi:NAD(P)H-dependent FMN reductase
MTKLLVVVGSTREGRRGRAVADWFLARARAATPEAEWAVADLGALDLPWFRSSRSPGYGPLDPHPSVARWAALVGASDGFVWVGAEYNHGYAAPLKNAIDHLYGEWARKPVAMVTYGGVAGGARAAEQLRLVAVELQMAPVRVGVHLQLMGIMTPDGGLAPTPPQDMAADQTAQDLLWWANALKAARAATVTV